MTSRRKARELALSCMYELEMAGNDPGVVIDRTRMDQDVHGAAVTFLDDAVRLAWEYHEKTDKIIEKLATGWKLDRIARVDLSILRLAIVELLIGIEDPTPPDPVVINEAVVLAKKFSTEDSGKFINGILASIMKEKEKYREMLTSKNE